MGITKKIMIYSLINIMPVSLSTTVIKASPLHNEGPGQIVQKYLGGMENEKAFNISINMSFNDYTNR